MKKKLTVLLAVTMTAGLMLTGCSGKKSSSKGETTVEKSAETTTASAEDSVVLNTKVDKLADYKGLKVEKSKATVSDSDVKTQLEYLKTQYATSKKKTSGKVKDGDVANIDYEGKIDGKTFDGGSATGYDLTIGSGSFIDGFEKGLIGKEIGKTVTLNLKFPSDYTDSTGKKSEYAGKKVVFTVKINSATETTKATINDKLIQDKVSEYTGAKTVEEYKKWLKSYIRSSKIFDAVWSDYLDKCDIKNYDDSDLKKAKETVQSQFESQLKSTYGYTLDQYKEAMSLSDSDWEEQLNNAAKSSVKSQAVLMAIAEKEGFTVSEADYQKRAGALAKIFNVKDVSAVESTIGGKSQTILYLYSQDVANVIADNAKVVKDSATTTQADTTTAGSDTTTQAETTKSSK